MRDRLGALPLFADLDDAQLERLAAATSEFDAPAGQAYLHDLAWARRYADANRREYEPAFSRAPFAHPAFSPTWIAAMPMESDFHETFMKPALVILRASSGSAGKFATDLGKY